MGEIKCAKEMNRMSIKMVKVTRGGRKIMKEVKGERMTKGKCWIEKKETIVEDKVEAMRKREKCRKEGEVRDRKFSERESHKGPIHKIRKGLKQSIIVYNRKVFI